MLVEIVWHITRSSTKSVFRKMQFWCRHILWLGHILSLYGLHYSFSRLQKRRIDFICLQPHSWKWVSSESDMFNGSNPYVSQAQTRSIENKMMVSVIRQIDSLQCTVFRAARTKESGFTSKRNFSRTSWPSLQRRFQCKCLTTWAFLLIWKVSRIY